MSAVAPVSDRAPRSIHPPADPGAQPPVAGVRGGWRRLTREPNAIWMREMRQSARLGRTPWILFSLVLVLSLLLASIGGLAATGSTSPAELGGGLFQTFFSLAYLVVVIVGPAVAANSIASEREGRTWEAVLLTGMTPKEIARGKFLAAYTTMALYIVALAPVGALSFLFGGVTAGEVVVAFAFLFLVAALAVAFGLAVSSLMSSLRGAIVVTLMLAIGLGPMLYFLGGFACSFAIHKVWAEVPEAFPIWLPLAYERAPFSVPYFVLLVGMPTLLVVVPAWFLYESTIANLSADSDDRSFGLKRWFAISTPFVGLALAIPSLLSGSNDARTGWCVAGILAFCAYVLFAAMLFASEPPGPSRRVRIHWQRARSTALRRFFGPGLFRTMLLVALFGLVGVGAIALVDGAALVAFGGAAPTDHYVEELFAFTAYAAPFVIFVVGFTAWLRARNASAWIARLVAAGILFLIAAVPWVVAAIAGVLAESHARQWLVIAAPSPFFVIPMCEAIDDSWSEAHLLVPAGIACAAAWGMLGLALLGAAGRRCRRLVAEHDATVKRADEALAAEERAAAEALPRPATEG